MIVTVIGIEKHASLDVHIPNGIECDACGARLVWDRKDFYANVEMLKSHGWIIEDLTKPTVCGQCVALIADVAQR